MTSSPRDTNLQNWDRPASEILQDINETVCDDCESDNEQDVLYETSVCCTTSEFLEYLDKMRRYALNRNQPEFLDKEMEFEDFLTRFRVETTEKQTKISDIFKL